LVFYYEILRGYEITTKDKINADKKSKYDIEF